MTSAAVAALTVSGCSDGAASRASAPSASAPTKPASPSSGPEQVPTSAPGSEPAPPTPPDAVRGPSGQRAFARYVMAGWSHALRTNDAGPLLAAGTSGKGTCRGCAELERELRRRDRAGWFVDFPGLEVQRIELAGQGRVRTATATVDVPQSDTFHDDGGYRSTNPAHEDAEFVVRMRWTDDGYRLLAFGVGAGR